MDPTTQLQLDLDAARARLEQARKALAPKHQGGEWEAYDAAYQDVLRLEREIALAKGEETAVPLAGWDVRWCTGVPAPHVLASDRTTLLTLIVHEPDPTWDGSSPKLVDPRSAEPRKVALVEFESCYVHKFGGPNDEVSEGFRWAGRGLEPYTAQEILNSAWLQEEIRIQSVHPMFDAARWADVKHYVLLLHDNLFECLARGFSVEVLHKSVPEVVRLAADRL